MDDKKYIVKLNTGDMYWDNIPEIEYYNSLKEVIEEYCLDEEQIKELEEYGNIYDSTEIEWQIIKNY